MDRDLLDWLTEPEDPSLCYRTLTELQDRDDRDPEVKALLCFAELPDLYGHPRVGRLVDYFLRRNGVFKSSDPRRFVNKDMQRPSFPVTWRANAWEVLYALSRMGRGEDPRLEKAWKHLESMTDGRGASILGWTHAQCPWKVGGRAQANKWLTFYALAAAKHRAAENRRNK